MMKTNTTNKKAYLAPVVKTVEFKVENGFESMTKMHVGDRFQSIRMQDVDYGNTYNSFNYSFGSEN